MQFLAKFLFEQHLNVRKSIYYVIIICNSFHETKYYKNKFIYCAVHVMRKSKQTFFVKVNCYKLRDFVFCMNDIFVNLNN